ncbi:MAG TPA: hypothetical protein VE445_08830 [Nitrososphaeraceae archaeon]|nr:hypothetical protein [Nitrososphaeraceae archaeon]
MRKTPGPFTSIFLMMLLLTGIIPTLTSIPSIIDIEAFAEKKGLKEDSDKDDKKDYQERYKHYDFEKYLSNQYKVYREYAQYYGDLLYNVENSDKNHHYPFFADEKFKEQDDDNRKQKHSDRDYNDDANDKSSDEKDSLSDKSEKKKTYKFIKIIECSNLNINQYDVEDLSDVEKIINAKEAKDSRDVEKILNQVRSSENNNHDDDDDYNNVKESHIKNNKAGHQEYNIGSETKIIFLCNNDNLNMDSTNDGNDMIRNSLPSEGIMLPISSLK